MDKKIFVDLKDGPLWAWLGLLTFVVATVVLLIGQASPLVLAGTCWIGFGGLCLFLGPNVLRCARNGHKDVLTVCVWSAVLLAAFVVAFFYWYLVLVAGDAKELVGRDRMLNIVPAVVGIGAAFIGWYVHYQFSAKAHRTNNAFSVVMEMRKSAEFLKRYELVVRHFPVGTLEIPDEYAPYFSNLRVKELRAATADALDPAVEEKIEAIAALRYMLNYYEFIAVGIKARDLDDDLLLETVSEIIIGLHTRSQKLIRWINAPAPNGQGQPLAYCSLASVVPRWHEIIQKREFDLRRGG